MGTEFPWRWGRGTISANLDVIWGMSVSTFLLLYDAGVPVARVSYASDGCGVSGQDGAEEKWTEAAASDVEFTSGQMRIHTAWEANRRKFMEIDEDYKKKYNIDVENLNEARLKEFLAREFDTTVEHITSQISKTLLVSLNNPCLSGLHPHPLGLEWAQTGYRGARHGCSRPRRSPIPAFATRVPATFPR